MGVLRLFLALSVVALHTETDVFGQPGAGGFYAVNVFFVISGFYMAMILNEKYTEASPWLFYRSRLLRLFPTYLVGLILGVLVFWDSIREVFTSLDLPGRIFYIAQNLLMIPQDVSSILCFPTAEETCAPFPIMSINPPAWSLAVELAFYFVAPFVVRSPRRTATFFFAGVLYLLSLQLVHFPLDDGPFLLGDVVPYSYTFYPSSIVFLAAGILAYQLSVGLARPRYAIALGGALLLSMGPSLFLPFWQLPIIALAVPVLFKYTKSSRFDRLVGELSFPVYVLHWPIMEWLRPFYDDYLSRLDSVTFGTWVALLTIAGAVVVHFTIERVVNAYRASERFMGSGRLPEREFETPTGRAGRLAAGASVLVPQGLAVTYFMVPLVVVATLLLTQLWAALVI